MGVGAGLYMYDIVVKTFTFAISSTSEFLSYLGSPEFFSFAVKNKQTLFISIS